jgi:hypothetical protein
MTAVTVAGLSAASEGKIGIFCGACAKTRTRIIALVLSSISQY